MYTEVAVHGYRMHLRFRGVKRIRTMPDVLSTVEHTERQSCQEVTWREISGDGTKLEARSLYNSWHIYVLHWLQRDRSECVACTVAFIYFKLILWDGYNLFCKVQWSESMSSSDFSKPVSLFLEGGGGLFLQKYRNHLFILTDPKKKLFCIESMRYYSLINENQGNEIKMNHL